MGTGDMGRMQGSLNKMAPASRQWRQAADFARELAHLVDSMQGWLARTLCSSTLPFQKASCPKAPVQYVLTQRQQAAVKPLCSMQLERFRRRQLYKGACAHATKPLLGLFPPGGLHAGLRSTLPLHTASCCKAPALTQCQQAVHQSLLTCSNSLCCGLYQRPIALQHPPALRNSKLLHHGHLQTVSQKKGWRWVRRMGGEGGEGGLEERDWGCVNQQAFL